MILRIGGILWKSIPGRSRTWIARRFNSTFTASATGIITNEQGEVLLLNHLLRPESGWGAPGGFLNEGEQPDEGLRREIREETGIELADIRLYQCRTIRRHIEIVMTARAVGEPSVQSREILDLGWFSLDKMPQGMSRGQKAFIAEAIRNRHRTSPTEI